MQQLWIPVYSQTSLKLCWDFQQQQKTMCIHTVCNNDVQAKYGSCIVRSLFLVAFFALVHFVFAPKYRNKIINTRIWYSNTDIQVIVWVPLNYVKSISTTLLFVTKFSRFFFCAFSFASQSSACRKFKVKLFRWKIFTEFKVNVPRYFLIHLKTWRANKTFTHSLPWKDSAVHVTVAYTV